MVTNKTDQLNHSMKKNIIISFLGLALSGRAIAQEQATAPSGPVLWQGLHAGLLFGPALNFANTTVAPGSDPASQAFITPAMTAGRITTDYTKNMRGGMFGVQGGYDHRMHDLVIGGNLALLGVKVAAEEHFSKPATGTWVPVTEDLEHKLSFMGTLRGRGGYVINDRMMPSVQFGLAFGRASYYYDLDAAGSSDYHTVDEKRICVGWTTGLGFEYAVWRSLVAKAEYNYASMGRRLYTTNPDGRDQNLDTHFDVTFKDRYPTLLFGASWYFGL